MSITALPPKLKSLGITEDNLILEVTHSNGKTEVLTLGRGEGKEFNYRGLYMPEPSRATVQTCHFLIERPDKTHFFLEVETDDAEAVMRQLAKVSKKVAAAACEVCGAPAVGQYPEGYRDLCAVHLEKAQLSDALEDEVTRIARDWLKRYELLAAAEVSEVMHVVGDQLRNEQAKGDNE